MEKDKRLIDGIISDYYNSVEDRFFYRIKNEWKINASVVVFFLSVIFFSSNVIPILPGIIDDYLLFLHNFLKAKISLPTQEYNFWTKWSLGVIVSLIFTVLAFCPFKYWDKKDKKSALALKYMSFCYVFLLRKELKNYLINENEAHLEKSEFYFDKIIKSITKFRISDDDAVTVVSLGKLRKELSSQFDWVTFSDETNRIITQFSTINNKFKRRLVQRIELEKIVPLIDLITLYEFSKIKPEEKNSDAISLKNRKNDFLKGFANELETLSEIEIVKDSQEKKRHKIIRFFEGIAGLFSSNNIVVLFLSWLILLTFMFVISSVIIINALNIHIDSTILIGLLTAPFIGAITIVAAICAKDRTPNGP